MPIKPTTNTTTAEPGEPDEGPDQAGADDQGTTICITIEPGDQYRVYIDGQEDDAQQYGSIDAALKGVVKLVRSLPTDSSPASHQRAAYQQEQQSMEGGY